MRNLVLALLVAAVAFAAGWSFAQAYAEPGSACAESIRAVFSPGADDDFIELLRSANESIEVEMYQFSYEPLMNELIDANARGVDVRIILEPRLDGNDNVDAAGFLKAHGVEVRWASLSFARTHSKFAVVDGKKAVVGSHNWSRSAMLKNREAALFVEGGDAVSDVKRIFEQDWEIATPA